ncbi:cardiolipin synthase B [Sphingobium aquiterrae]|uniref:phospholipase D-like domain-containing protein n=1 Tax=Sphingobium aquiterrae TaxID=2038656 RepID=UPI00301B452D
MSDAGAERREQADEEIVCTIAGNRLRVIEQGPALLDALVTLIDGAQHSLKIFYYIFESDRSGRRVLARMIRALRRGVTVTLMIDAFGSSGAEEGFFNSFVGAGGRFGLFGARRSTRYLIRNHQKIALADDMRLMIGGFNVGDAYFGLPEEDCWDDLGLLIEGPQVAPMVRWYGQLWHWVSSRKQRFGTLRAMVRHWRRAGARQVDDGVFRWLIGGPTRLLSPWAQVVKHDLERARRLDMIEAYFSPGQGMLKRIGAIAARAQESGVPGSGGGVRLMMPAKSDNGATVSAARLLYGPLLKRGVDIFEYQPCKLHMKLIVVDDAVYVGSANFDMRSLFLNLEVMLRVEDAGFARRMTAFVDRHIAQSRQITPEVQRRRRGPLTLLKWWISYLLVGVLDYTVTRRLNFRYRRED